MFATPKPIAKRSTSLNRRANKSEEKPTTTEGSDTTKASGQTPSNLKRSTSIDSLVIAPGEKNVLIIHKIPTVALSVNERKSYVNSTIIPRIIVTINTLIDATATLSINNDTQQQVVTHLTDQLSKKLNGFDQRLKNVENLWL